MKMIILVGLPGSGKSTIAEKYFPKYVRISQDELGSREAAIKKCTQTLEAGLNVIIDRCNMSVSQRKHWIDLALNHDVEVITVIKLVVDPEECVARLMDRKNHPTIGFDLPLNQKRDIIYKFAQESEPVSLEEGITNIIITRN